MMTVTQASEALGVAPSTAHRLLAVLQDHGFVAQDGASRAYRAGRGLLEIGLAALSNLDVRAVARPDLDWLVDEVGETVQLIILEGRRTLVVDSVESRQAVRVSARTGGSAPPNCVAAGKVLLARRPFEQVRALLGPDPLEKLTSRSIGTLAELEVELERVREQGFALNLGENEPGLTSVAVEIPVPHMVTPAAITLSAPSTRMPQERIPVVVEVAHQGARRIATRLEATT